MFNRHAVKKVLGVLMLLVLCFALGAETVISNIDDTQEIISQVQANNINTVVSSDAGVDADGNLLQPFDIAYSDAFESGDIEYDDGSLLLKFSSTFSGAVNAELSACGIQALEPLMNSGTSVWYTATLKEDAVVTATMASSSSSRTIWRM